MRIAWCALLLMALPALAQELKGRWDGTISYGTLKIPFTLHFDGPPDRLTGSFVNGESRVTSSTGAFANGQLRLTFESSKTRLEASLADGELKGTYVDARGSLIPFKANAYCTCSYEGEAGPDISGLWHAQDVGWRLQVRRNGDDTLVMLSRPTGELGPLTGRFDGAGFNLHYFDGNRAALLEIEVGKDKMLQIALLEPGQDVKKYRVTAAANAN